MEERRYKNATRYVAFAISFVLAYGIFATISSSGATRGLQLIQKVLLFSH